MIISSTDQNFIVKEFPNGMTSLQRKICQILLCRCHVPQIESLNIRDAIVSSNQIDGALNSEFKLALFHPPASKASSEVENFDWEKNPHTHVYGVKEFVTLSVCLSRISTPIIPGLAE